MKKLEYLFAGVAVAALITGYLIFRSEIFTKTIPSVVNTKPPVANSGLPSKADLKIPAGEVVELIKAKNWTGLSSQFSKPQQREGEIDSKLSQIIFSLDSNLVEDTAHENIAYALILIIDSPNELQPRSMILLSKCIGKLKLSESLKSSIHNKYKKNKWTSLPHWLDASIGWSPLPDSTLKMLNSLIVKNRSDLTSDYFYYLNKIDDPQILKNQIRLTKNKIKKFSGQQKTYFEAQLAQIERRL
jgi:hypothetical protein